jgi:anthranilate phosphoribosyltransferase
MSDRVRAALAAVIEGRSLGFDEARETMGSVMDGEATTAQLAALLVALRMRGETVDELTGFATAMRERVLPVEAPAGTIDVVGTGGDGSGTFNISTTSALVVAAAGIPVAKHGNRAITSKSGAADVLEALGVRVDHDAASAADDLRRFNFAFLFAPGFHPAMRHAGPTRREIGVRTAFNLLGPLTNPAGAKRALIGVGDASVAAKIAEVARRLGTIRTLIVCGAGVDELPLDGTGVIRDVSPAGIHESSVDPGGVGLRAAATSDLAGGTAAENAALTVAILEGHGGARRDVVLLNAGAAFVAAEQVANLSSGIALAAETIDSGAARHLLERLREAKLAADAARGAAGGGAS